MAGTQPLEAPLFVEEDGLVVMEAESHPPVKGWTRKTEPAGFSGSGCLKAEGGGLTCFPIFIGTPGRYTMNLHSRHDHDRGDLENDAFVRMDDGPFIRANARPRAAIHPALTTLRKSFPDTGSRKRAEQIAPEIGPGGGQGRPGAGDENAVGPRIP
jgi:hypothetical protein